MESRDEKNPLIISENVTKVYGGGDTRVEALNGVSLSIYPGEIVSIMGPSGCGKTTLLNCLSGIDLPTSGNVLFDNIPLIHLSEKKRDQVRAGKMGFVFQTYNLIPVLTAIENIELPLLCQGIRADEATQKAKGVLEKVGLNRRMNHLPAELSTGQQQRVAIARAIVNQPKLIWADEPTGALDRQTTDMVLDLIEHLHRVEGISFVIVTHDPRVAERSDRVVYLDSGRMIQERTRNKGR